MHSVPAGGCAEEGDFPPPPRPSASPTLRRQHPPQQQHDAFGGVHLGRGSPGSPSPFGYSVPGSRSMFNPSPLGFNAVWEGGAAAVGVVAEVMMQSNERTAGNTSSIEQVPSPLSSSFLGPRKRKTSPPIMAIMSSSAATAAAADSSDMENVCCSSGSPNTWPTSSPTRPAMRRRVEGTCAHAGAAPVIVHVPSPMLLAAAASSTVSGVSRLLTLVARR